MPCDIFVNVETKVVLLPSELLKTYKSAIMSIWSICNFFKIDIFYYKNNFFLINSVFIYTQV